MYRSPLCKQNDFFWLHKKVPTSLKRVLVCETSEEFSSEFSSIVETRGAGWQIRMQLEWLTNTTRMERSEFLGHNSSTEALRVDKDFQRSKISKQRPIVVRWRNCYMAQCRCSRFVIRVAFLCAFYVMISMSLVFSLGEIFAWTLRNCGKFRWNIFV